MAPENGAENGARHGAGNRANGDRPARRRKRPDAAAAARAAAEHVLALTGRELEGVVGIERADDGWLVSIEVVESRRIPDTADVLAVYEVEAGDDGELYGLRRSQRYSRGMTGRAGR